MKYSIKDLERLTGIKAHTIRIWEKRYNIVRPLRTSSNIRYYSDKELKHLLNVSILNRNGFKISTIVRLSKEEIINSVIETADCSVNFENQIDSLILAMIDLDEYLFEKSISASILKLGFNETVSGILYPLLEKIGLLWQIDSINPAHEHFITNLIRQKLILAIDEQVNAVKPDAKTFVLFLPEGELHELSLLYYSFLIKKCGHRVIYLGQSLPLEALQQMQQIIHPDFLVTVVTSAISKKDLRALISSLSDQFTDQTILLGGHQITELPDPQPQNVLILRRKTDLEKFLIQLD